MAIWLGPMGKPKNKRPPKFTATGTAGVDYLYTESTDGNGIVHFEIAVLNPCAFTFSRIVPVDLALFGGGKSGEKGSYNDIGGEPNDYGGDGGDGGKLLRVSNVTLSTGVQYLVNVGTSDEETIMEAGSIGESYSTGDSGALAGKTGGSGARSYGPGFGQSHDASAGADGEYPWDAGATASENLPGILFGPGGGGGGVTNRTYYISKSSAAGGNNGGGHGGSSGNVNGTAGADNRAAGGGGGYTNETGYSTGLNSGSPGGSGIAFIRDHR